MILQLFGASVSQILHVIFSTKVQAPSRTRLDACRLEAFTDAISAQRAFVDTLGDVIQLGNIERTARDAIAAADAVILLEIHNTVRILHNRAVRRTSFKATRFR